MDLSLGTSSLPIPAISSSSEQLSVSPILSSSTPVSAAPRAMTATAMIAQSLLMPSALSQVQVVSIFVARRLVPPARYLGPDNEEKKRGEFIRRVKVAKTEATGQQTQNRS